MSIEYEIKISINVGNAFDSVGAFLERVNTSLSMCGFDEKLSVRAEAITCSLTCERKLDEVEKDLIVRIILEEFNRFVPNFEACVESFRSKSGNSSSKSV